MAEEEEEQEEYGWKAGFVARGLEVTLCGPAFGVSCRLETRKDRNVGLGMDDVSHFCKDFKTGNGRDAENLKQIRDYSQTS